MIRRELFFIIAVQLFLAGIARSEEAASTNAPTVLPEVVVTGHPAPQSLTSPSIEHAAEQKKEVPGGFTIKSAKPMEQGRASNFEDLLQGTPGLFLQTDNGTEVTKISIRGSAALSEDEPLGVQFLLDGLSLNQGDGEAILEDFDLATIQYAEVFRGANAFKYGSITLGGAINLVPMTGHNADRFRVRLEGGSYDYFRGQLSSGGVHEPIDYVVSVMGRYRDGFRDHSREDTERFFGNLGHQISEDIENRVYLTLSRVDRDLPGGLTKQELNDKPQEANEDAVELDFNKNWEMVRVADKITFRATDQQFDAGLFWVYRDVEERDFFEPDFRQGITAYYSHNVGGMANYVSQGDLFGHRNILTVGMAPQFEIENTHNYENLDGDRGATTARDQGMSVNAPFYAENQFYLTEKLSLVTGVQAIFALRRFTDHFDSDDDGDQSKDLTFYSFNPKVGMICELNEQNQVFANVSRSWQPPSFDNMVEFEEGLNSSVVFTKLRPQRAWTVEVGMRGEQGRFGWELALYRAWLHDELLELNDAQGNEIGAVNVHRSYHQGIEAGLEIELAESIWCKKKEARPGDRLALNQSYTLNDFHFEDDDVYGHNRIAGIPVHLYRAELLYTAPCGFYAGPNVQWNLTHYPVDHANTLFADAYTLVGFKIGYRQNKGFSVFFEAKNLTDERYAASIEPIADAQTVTDPIQVFQPGDGRSFYGGVSWSW